jgi:2,4-dienoyl-CoA reductase-like NADH-dependent reductase (Old Yellow Enzyme family)
MNTLLEAGARVQATNARPRLVFQSTRPDPTRRSPTQDAHMPASLSDPVPFTRGPALKNRFVLAPMANDQSRADGTLGDDEYRWLVSRAQAGFAMTLTTATWVHLAGKGMAGQLGISDDAHVAGLERLARGLHAAGATCAVQLYHGGRRAIPLPGQPPVAPWDDAETGARALSTAEVEQVVEDFVRAAERADRAGFDGVELHGAHGYLLAAFLDRELNHRTDRYGGSPENRARALFDVVDGIRARCRPDFQLGVRLSPERWGIDIGEMRTLAQRLMTSGQIDYLDLSLWDCFKAPNDSAYAHAPLIDHFTSLERGSTRLGVAGKIMDAATAQRCIDHGADFVLIGRGAILHPDFAMRAIADPGFRSVERPVSSAYLRERSIGDAFVTYLRTWKGFVSD